MDRIKLVTATGNLCAGYDFYSVQMEEIEPVTLDDFIGEGQLTERNDLMHSISSFDRFDAVYEDSDRNLVAVRIE